MPPDVACDVRARHESAWFAAILDYIVRGKQPVRCAPSLAILRLTSVQGAEPNEPTHRFE
jgi:hypothetical protein